MRGNPPETNIEWNRFTNYQWTYLKVSFRMFCFRIWNIYLGLSDFLNFDLTCLILINIWWRKWRAKQSFTLVQLPFKVIDLNVFKFYVMCQFDYWLTMIWTWSTTILRTIVNHVTLPFVVFIVSTHCIHILFIAFIWCQVHWCRVRTMP